MHHDNAKAELLPPRARLLRAAELTALYVVVPVFIDLRDRWTSRMLMPALLLLGLVLFIILWRDRTFDRRSLWNWRPFIRELPRILITALLSFLSLVGVTWWLSHQSWVPEEVHLWALIKRNPELFIAICLLYPIFSVYPQEIVLRTFFFHRYRGVFRSPWTLLTVNALIFAWVHVIFRNVPAVVLCIPAGFLFGYTYLKTKSTIASGFEHAIVGNVMWTVGLGWFFFGGAVAVTAERNGAADAADALREGIRPPAHVVDTIPAPADPTAEPDAPTAPDGAADGNAGPN